MKSKKWARRRRSKYLRRGLKDPTVSSSWLDVIAATFTPDAVRLLDQIFNRPPIYRKIVS